MPMVDQLSCVWLLTPPTATNDGNRHFSSDAFDTELATFLQECVTTGRRDVREFANYMRTRHARYLSYGDQASSYFTTTNRSTYFDFIPSAALTRSVVFFDPDNGLEPRTVVTAAHLKYSELQTVFNRMDDCSIAVIYQHSARQPRDVFWPSIADRVRISLKASVGYLESGDVGFFIVLRNQDASQFASAALRHVQQRWPTKVLVANPGR